MLSPAAGQPDEPPIRLIGAQWGVIFNSLININLFALDDVIINDLARRPHSTVEPATFPAGDSHHVPVGGKLR